MRSLFAAASPEQLHRQCPAVGDRQCPEVGDRQCPAAGDRRCPEVGERRRPAGCVRHPAEHSSAVPTPIISPISHPSTRRFLLVQNSILAAAIFPITFLLAHPAAAQPSGIDPVFAEWQAKADPAVENALAYLQHVQKDDGSFEGTYGDSTGVPALVGMAFLSKGHMPTEGPYTVALNRCIDFILANQKPDGVFEKGSAGNGPMYAHNISTLFLSEVSGMVDPDRQARISAALPKALALILRAQAVTKDDNNRGGWRYQPGARDSDTSCSGWALMALRSAKLNGAAIPDTAIAAAVDYLHHHQQEKDGCFGYTGRDDHALTLTGMGLLCLELSGEHGSERTKHAADWLLRNFRSLPGNQFEHYANYYNAQGMFQIGGRHWQEYANWMYATYLPKQLPDGSWDSHEAGRTYGTAMMVLAFTVPWRQLPIYQRDETVDEDAR